VSQGIRRWSHYRYSRALAHMDSVLRVVQQKALDIDGSRHPLPSISYALGQLDSMYAMIALDKLEWHRYHNELRFIERRAIERIWEAHVQRFVDDTRSDELIQPKVSA